MTNIGELAQLASAPLGDAKSLPFSAYTDPAVLAAESEEIFAKEWTFVCMAGELAEPGDYFAMTLAGEPIIVLRDDSGELRALSNICRHRGTLLLDEGFGKVDKYITCPYHAWAYDKAGALKAIPYNKLIAVDRAEHQLVRFSVGAWNGLVFVNLDSHAPSLEERLEGIDDYLQLFEPGELVDVSSGETEIWQANWKLAMENAMESYHLFQVHDKTLELYSPSRDAYYIAGSSKWSLTGGKTNRQKGLIERLLGSGHDELFEHYILVALPPSFVGILSYGSFGWLSAHPIDAETTQIRSGVLVSRGGKSAAEDAAQKAFTQAFFKEDKDMCERVQKGMRAKHGRGGTLVDMERIVVDFHQFFGTRLAGEPHSALFEDEAAQSWRDAPD